MATAPGRCTLAGEHVDYAGGLVLCIAVDLAVAVAARASSAGYGVASDGTVARRDRLVPAGDIADLPLAAAQVLGDAGIKVPTVELGIAATLPAGAGLSSSAAVVCATLAALLRLCRRTLDPATVARLALEAERDVVGVPCGPLDQRAVVHAPAGGALLLDCRDGGMTTVPWGLRGVGLVAVHTGETHDVGGSSYRRRRDEAERARVALGVPSLRSLTEADLDGLRLPDPLPRRVRHIVGETARAAAAAEALRTGDAVTLGAVMSASHASLRDDYEVSTGTLDAVVAAARSVRGCHGARLVGAGFGGSVVALVEDAAADGCIEAMTGAAGPGCGGAWRLHPGPGLALTCPDALR